MTAFFLTVMRLYIMKLNVFLCSSAISLDSVVIDHKIFYSMYLFVCFNSNEILIYKGNM